MSSIVTCLGETSAIVEDVVEYSNRMSTYRFELDAEELVGLETRLRSEGIVLEPRDSSGSVDVDDEGYAFVTLAIVFPEEDGTHKIPNPDLG